MQFLSKKPKINISAPQFYLLTGVVAIMVLANTVFFGISMSTRNLMEEVVRTHRDYNFVKMMLISNYIAFNAVLMIFAVHTLLARNRFKVGYVYTNLWNVLFVALVAIPFVMSPNFSDYRIWVNVGFFLIFEVVIFNVYKSVYEFRRMNGYWVKENGGMEW